MIDIYMCIIFLHNYRRGFDFYRRLLVSRLAVRLRLLREGKMWVIECDNREKILASKRKVKADRTGTGQSE